MFFNSIIYIYKRINLMYLPYIAHGICPWTKVTRIFVLLTENYFISMMTWGQDRKQVLITVKATTAIAKELRIQFWEGVLFGFGFEKFISGDWFEMVSCSGGFRTNCNKFIFVSLFKYLKKGCYYWSKK